MNLTIAGRPPVATPMLRGLTRADAEAGLVSAGLVLGEVSEVYDSVAEASTVASQTPNAGAVVPRGTAVSIVVSKGPAPVPVPPVKGKTQAVATQELQAAGFVVVVKLQEGPAANGTVIAQDPDAVDALPGSTVTITVSTGIPMVTVPNLIGLYPDKQLDAVVAEAGLRVKKVSIHGPVDPDSADTDIGSVYRQTPKAGALVPKGTVVEVRSWWESN